MDLANIKNYLVQLQQDICNSLESTDGKANFMDDKWIREEGGGGLSKVIQNGEVFEKGGVNFSHVHGKLPDILKSESRQANYFHATGVSIVIHPQN
ncbi:MAG TPA: coproporphyrinogen III oxidase, partial [Chitinophagales bacterium]|nr:coproporphyrinogen III oxidase [Chitinophagales bacterium]